jgi:hypothetical protein
MSGHDVTYPERLAISKVAHWWKIKKKVLYDKKDEFTRKGGWLLKSKWFFFGFFLFLHAGSTERLVFCLPESGM